MLTKLNENRSVAELLLENPARAIIFEEYHIDYCCNGKVSLLEACARRGVKSSEVAGRLAACAAGQAQSSCTAAAAASCAELISHIIGHHHAFLRRELPRLGVLAEKVARVHGDHAPNTIEVERVFAAMRAELEEHMMKEEQVLFPFIEKLESGSDTPFPTIGAPISCMEHEHDAVGKALEQLRNLTDEFEPPMDACNSWRVLYHGLRELEKDLHQHIHEENNVLFPRALAMEEALRGNVSGRYTG